MNDGKKDVISKEIEEAEKAMLLEQYNTAKRKAKFLSDIKGGLGADIKKNPGRAHIIKKTWFQKFMVKLKAIFTKF
jgi:hypothetical protein